MSAGNAGLIARTIEGMAERSPESFRRAMYSDEWLTLGLEAFHARLKAHTRDATLAYLRVIGTLGGDQDRALLVWLAARGVVSVERGEAMLETARRALDASETDALRLAYQLVREHVRSDPAERRRALQEIFGAMEVGEATAPALLHASKDGPPLPSDAPARADGQP